MPHKTPEARSAYNKAYRERRRDELSAMRKARFWARREEYREKAKAYRESHREEIRTNKAVYQRANPEICRAAGKRHRERVRGEMIAAYGGRCACCGEDRETFLTLDHANGNGGADRRQHNSRGNATIIRELRRKDWPQEGYRLLCWNCQYGTQLTGGCPHQRRSVSNAEG